MACKNCINGEVTKRIPVMESGKIVRYERKLSVCPQCKGVPLPIDRDANTPTPPDSKDRKKKPKRRRR